MIDTLTILNDDVLAEIAAEKKLRQTNELFLLFSLGSQFDHLIKMALDKLGVYCLVADPASVAASDVGLLQPKGIILSGGPASAETEAPPFDMDIFDLGIPVLGICLGFQLWASHLGIDVRPANKQEYGVHKLVIYNAESALFASIESGTDVLQSHSEHIALSARLNVLGATDNAQVAAGQAGHLWGVQFHPEVSATIQGDQIFANFCFRICGAQDRFPAENEAHKKILNIRNTIGKDKVLLALSGGSDSSVVAGLLQAAVTGPGQVLAVYIKGVDRPDDESHVHEFFGSQDWLELKVVDATKEFLHALAGLSGMHEKRVALRGVYKDVLEREAKAFDAKFIFQGTLYTDISESGKGLTTGARKARIKLHHNVDLNFSIEEVTPLDDCVKDSARQIGRSIGVAEELLSRQPFPGPGLVVRIEGEVTAENLAIARAADGIFISALRQAGLYEGVWQAGAVVTNSVSTYTKGDDAGTGLLLLLWAVWSVNGFTATWAELPNDFLRSVSTRLTNEIPEISRVAQSISSKPPATLEYG